ncbi:hypothetical protein BCR33DRAFT_378998 [Rhizoclosmatium globosum]|uniref:Uncharacterized protein n=1 Tax=Rhizoclosmatium globosum TaxID=329046 RepID=A0A1Y2BZ36_9FUNG|nr:hypothetical protein BCR33DRAFT_378998 [Rhizoclosmatium globosum]|eukprot:ORY39944.1 hypothetical protein BCR33DRAFT_378998 [Rhizoclosmatium globosum]
MNSECSRGNLGSNCLLSVMDTVLQLLLDLEDATNPTDWILFTDQIAIECQLNEVQQNLLMNEQVDAIEILCYTLDRTISSSVTSSMRGNSHYSSQTLTASLT